MDGCFQNLLEGNAFFLLFIVILNISVKWNNLLTKIIRNHVKQCSYHKWYWKLQSKSFNRYIQFNFILHVIRMSLLCHLYIRGCHSYIIRMSLVCTRISSVCHSYVFVCHSYVTPIYLYIIRMSHVCTRMSFVCHSYVLVCHLYVTRIYSYVIYMSLVCTRMSFVCHSSVALPWTLVKRVFLIIDYSLDKRIVRYKVKNYFYSAYKWLLLKVMIGVLKTFWNDFVKIKSVNVEIFPGGRFHLL